MEKKKNRKVVLRASKENIIKYQNEQGHENLDKQEYKHSPLILFLTLLTIFLIFYTKNTYSDYKKFSKIKDCENNLSFKVPDSYKYNLIRIIKKEKFIDCGSVFKAALTKGTTYTTINYNNGDEYVGYIKDGKPNGQGIYLWANGNKYEGNFIDGNKTGKGTFTWADGDKYVGDFAYDELTGGTFTWANGDKYEGDYIGGKRTGKGTYVWANGNKYVGDFIDGKISGKGTYTFKNGDKYIGEFRDGKFVDGQKIIKSVELEKKLAAMSSEDRNAYNCEEKFNFKKGTEQFNKCVYELYKAELDIQKLELEKQVAEANAKAAQSEKARADAIARAQIAAANASTRASNLNNTLQLLELSARLINGPPRQAAPATPRLRATCSYNGWFLNCF